MSQIASVRRARALVGTRFRPQGRDALGIDCVGLIMAAFEVAPDAVRRDYQLRGDHQAELLAEMRRWLRPVRPARAGSGDAIAVNVGPEQVHLAVLTEHGFIHADAKLRKVVETPGPVPWTVVAAFRENRGSGRPKWRP